MQESEPTKAETWGQVSKKREVWEGSVGGGANWNDDGKMGLGWGKELEMALLVGNYNNKVQEEEMSV